MIGAGFGRTGTASLKQALEILGFGPCHHMEEVIQHPSENPTWEAAARGEDVDWVAFMAPWGSSVDWPSSLHYEALARAFPEAKVILGTRDADRWYDSFAATILPMMKRFPNPYIGPWVPFLCGPFRSTSRTLSARLFAGGEFTDRTHMIQAFHAHEAAVRRTIPPERLLVFRPEQGWQPLCEFLGVPVPDREFPRVNDTAEFQRRARMANVVCWLLLLFPPLLAVSATICWLQRRRAPVLKRVTTAESV